jgi:glc operon protein GlcG
MRLISVLTISLALSLGTAVAQVPDQFVLTGKGAQRHNDRTSINAATAKRLVEACEKIALSHNSQAVILVIDRDGLPVSMLRMDGTGYVSVKATENKTRTALLTRAPSVVLANRQVRDPFTEQHMEQYGLTVQEGGFPIIVNGQLIGAMGVGGIPPAERTATYDEQTCARDALIAVFGPQPPLIAEAPPAPQPAAAR